MSRPGRRPTDDDTYYHDIFNDEGKFTGRIPIRSTPHICKMNTGLKISLAVFLLLNFFIISACEKQKTGWKGTISHENGITVVRNPQEPFYGELTLELEEDLAIGREEDENYLFFRISDMQVDSHGSIYVLDSGNQRIQKYDMDGNYLQTIGRKGQGPGEFERPYRMALDEDTNIIVSEGRKIQMFSQKGEYIKGGVVPLFVLNFTPDTDGNILAHSFVRAEKGQNFGIVSIDWEGKILKRIQAKQGFADTGLKTGRASKREFCKENQCIRPAERIKKGACPLLLNGLSEEVMGHVDAVILGV